MNPADLIGQQLAGKYTLLELLGVGGFGAVYRASQAPIDRTVAVKINLHPHRHDMVARFVREARVQAGLRHPGCVMLLDCGHARGHFYLVQEFVEGRALKDLLQLEGALAPARALDLACQVLDALGEAHRHGVVHRDIKPANIMLTRGVGGREEVRVLDFGIAKIVGEAVEEGDHLTDTGVALGTPAYMAPEQIRPGPIGPSTDVYAVGVTLYHMLTGRRPFSGAKIDVLFHQLNSPPPPLGATPSALDAVIARAMSKAPGDRYPTAAQMRAALAAVDLAALPAPQVAPTPTVTAQPARWTPADAADDTLIVDPATSDGTPAFVGSVQPAETPSPSPRRLEPWAVPAAGVLVALLVGSIIAAVHFAAEPEDDPSALVTRPDPTPALTPHPGHPAAEHPAAEHPDIAPPDAGPDAAPLDAEPDAAPPKPRPEPTRPSYTPKPPPPPPPDPDRYVRQLTRALDRCACDDARRAATRLDRLGDARLPALKQRIVEQCQMFLPGNCRTRDR